MEEWQKSRSFMESLQHAMSGIGVALKRDANARKHFFIGFAAIALGLFLRLSVTEFAIIVLLISVIIAMEMVNTVIEYIGDILHPEYHASIKRLKDITAGAVLVIAFGGIIIGLLVFGPPLADLFR